MNIKQTTHKISVANKLDHFLARIAWNRSSHTVEPGLWAIGKPDRKSPVFVTANYTLSFDALRTSLKGIDGYILVLNTFGVNVWCAAGKKTFSTEELLNQIESTQLAEVVDSKKLILPQLGAPGINANEIRMNTRFTVKYGPVRATDIPEYMETGITDEMRKVHFPLKDRMVLIPVEFILTLIPAAIIGTVFYFLGGVLMTLAFLVAAFAGAALFPILLPHLPTYNFASKGFILGALVTLPFAVLAFLNTDYVLWQKIAWSMTYMLMMPSFTAFLTLQFTGSSTYTSKHGVKKEIFRYGPVMAYHIIAGLVISITSLIINYI